MILDWRSSPRGADLKPSGIINDKNGKIIKLDRGVDARYSFAPNVILSLENGSKVNAGDVIARIPTESAKTKDITGGFQGLPNYLKQGRQKIMLLLQSDGKNDGGLRIRLELRLFQKILL